MQHPPSAVDGIRDGIESDGKIEAVAGTFKNAQRKNYPVHKIKGFRNVSFVTGACENWDADTRGFIALHCAHHGVAHYAVDECEWVAGEPYGRRVSVFV